MTGEADEVIRAAVGDELTEIDEVVLRPVASAFNRLEQEIAREYATPVVIRYPSAIRALYSYVFPTLDCQLVRLLGAPSGDPVRFLRELAFDCYEPALILGRGLLPVAEDGNDGGPLVVDLAGGAAPDDAPVLLWDHETDAPGDPLYPNSTVMLAAAAHLLRGGSVRDLGQVGASAAATEYDWWDDD